MSEYDGSVVHHDLQQCIEALQLDGWVVVPPNEDLTGSEFDIVSTADREWFDNARWEEAEARERRFRDEAVEEQALGRNV